MQGLESRSSFKQNVERAGPYREENEKAREVHHMFVWRRCSGDRPTPVQAVCNIRRRKVRQHRRSGTAHFTSLKLMESPAERPDVSSLWRRTLTSKSRQSGTGFVGADVEAESGPKTRRSRRLRAKGERSA